MRVLLRFEGHPNKYIINVLTMKISHHAYYTFSLDRCFLNSTKLHEEASP